MSMPAKKRSRKEDHSSVAKKKADVVSDSAQFSSDSEDSSDLDLHSAAYKRRQAKRCQHVSRDGKRQLIDEKNYSFGPPCPVALYVEDPGPPGHVFRCHWQLPIFKSLSKAMEFVKKDCTKDGDDPNQFHTILEEAVDYSARLKNRIAAARAKSGGETQGGRTAGVGAISAAAGAALSGKGGAGVGAAASSSAVSSAAHSCGGPGAALATGGAASSSTAAASAQQTSASAGADHMKGATKRKPGVPAIEEVRSKIFCVCILLKRKGDVDAVESDLKYERIRGIVRQFMPRRVEDQNAYEPHYPPDIPRPAAVLKVLDAYGFTDLSKKPPHACFEAYIRDQVHLSQRDQAQGPLLNRDGTLKGFSLTTLAKKIRKSLLVLRREWPSKKSDKHDKRVDLLSDQALVLEFCGSPGSLCTWSDPWGYYAKNQTRFYSFCDGEVVIQHEKEVQHCLQCNHCFRGPKWHCLSCGMCNYGERRWPCFECLAEAAGITEEEAQESVDGNTWEELHEEEYDDSDSENIGEAMERFANSHY